jgi:hypothetical protein
MFRQNRVAWVVLVSFLAIGILLPLPRTVWADTTEFKSLIKAMKETPRGPFSGIKWFCEDGEILPPRPFACSAHGGGVQHGQLSEPAEKLRIAGYQVANVFAAIQVTELFETNHWREDLGQILLERFLIDYDEGWIFRGARFYRGALQEEDETRAAEDLIKSLSRAVYKENQDFLLLREAYRLLPRQGSSVEVTAVRNLAGLIADSDSNFLPIRSKIHNQLDLLDARRVREHALNQGLDSLLDDYEKLAKLIEQVYASGDIAKRVSHYARMLNEGELRLALRKGANILTSSDNDESRLEQAGILLRHLRQSYPRFQTDYSRLATLELSLQLEQEVFLTANRIINQVHLTSRARKLEWLGSISEAIYGSGLISEREWMATGRALGLLSKPRVSLDLYRDELRYLNRLPGWAGQWLNFHFEESIGKLSGIEPLAERYIPDRLRSSPLLAFGLVLDRLIKDANELSGVDHQLFGKSIGAGLRSLNPGLARGILRLPENGKIQLEAGSIVLLPETTAELSPVAGILTMGEGNALSHVQLLAGNLGIPNVVISQALQPLLWPMEDRTVVLAVSPGGIVKLEADSKKWHEYFSRQITLPEGTISPDMGKLDLQQDGLLSLADLRARFAGRISGPKAANLGELKYHFPQAVTSGLLVPFGVFRELLNQPYPGESLTVFEWMQSEYRRISSLSPPQGVEANRLFLEQLRAWILNAEPGKDFRRQLSRRLTEIFGEEGTYAVFVRSDTNVEDLPGFTGAGLNLTVSNVTGFENVLLAIRQVWASPFSERAFAWRQKRMSDPEHVYPSVLLMKSVSVDKSGVMLTLDTQTGKQNMLTVAVNEGIGGAVQGQSAEELLIDPVRNDIRLLADATASKKRVLNVDGGLVKKQLDADGQVLSRGEINQLIKFAHELSVKFPQLDDAGIPTAADVEFGFENGQLVLFQVRPYLKNRRVKKNHYLNQLDRSLDKTRHIMVDMNASPGEG